jgi:3-dehydroquinate synthase
MAQQLTVDLGERSYPIYIGAGLLRNPELISRHVRGGQVLVVSNETVAPLYLEPVLAACQGLQTDTCILPDGEQYKNLDTLNRIFDTLLARRHNRSTTLLALGGGVVGDMTGFAAACYQRGVDFVQLPTTLLAQVDSSVGGKTAVNHSAGKNMIGAFYQPRCVIADIDTLASLPAREFAAGLAEIVKYGLIADSDFFLWLETHCGGLLARDSALLEAAIYRSCDNKARVVSRDEREGGLRAILNLGHTFAHAIETWQGYRDWLHGEAVAAGMVIAGELSARMGWIDPALVERIVQLLSTMGLPVAPPQQMDSREFLELMAVDKKVLDGRLRLILLQALGKACVSSEAPSSEIIGAIDASRRHNRVLL